MTSQSADWVLYNGEEYELLGDSSRRLPMIKRYGIEPVPMGTGCYRGFIASYEIVDDLLYLTYLDVQDANDHYPEIGGVKPSSEYGLYENLSEPMLIDGAIVIGKDVPDNWSIPDIRGPHDYVVVLKLALKSGQFNLLLTYRYKLRLYGTRSET